MVMVAMPIVVVIVVMVVVVVVMMVAAAVGIGAGLGVERRLEGFNAGAETLGHGGQHVVRLDAQAVVEEGGGGVAVAEVPGEAGQRKAVGGVDVHHRLRLGLDHQDAAVVHGDPVAAPEAGRLRKVEQDLLAAFGREGQPAAMAQVEVEAGVKGCSVRLFAMGKEVVGTDQFGSPSNTLASTQSAAISAHSASGGTWPPGQSASSSAVPGAQLVHLRRQ